MPLTGAFLTGENAHVNEFLIFILRNNKNRLKYNNGTRGKSYKSFYSHNLGIFVLGKPFPA